MQQIDNPSAKSKVDPKTIAEDISLVDHEKNLRMMSMAFLISEMHALREVLDEKKSDLPDSSVNEDSRKVLEQKESTTDKLLAVEMEIGRRMRVPSKAKS